MAGLLPISEGSGAGGDRTGEFSGIRDLSKADHGALLGHLSQSGEPNWPRASQAAVSGLTNVVPCVTARCACNRHAGSVVTVDAMHCQKKHSSRPPPPAFI